MMNCYKNIIKIFDRSALNEVDWKTVRGQHVAFKNGQLVAGNPRVFGKKYITTESKGNKIINIKKDFKGSEKQVKWANDIVENTVNSMNKMIEFCNKRIKEENEAKLKNPASGVPEVFEERKEGLNEVLNKVIDQINKIDNASDIIDKRKMFDPSNLSDLADKIIKQRKQKNYLDKSKV